VWIAVGLAALLFFMYADIQAKKVNIATLEGDNTSKQQTIDDYKQKLLSYATVIDTLKADLVRSRKTLKELEFVRDEFNDLRRKFVELQDKPYTCPELETRYEDYSIDIARKYNGFLRGKISSVPAPADSSGPGPTVSNPTTIRTAGPETKAN
jgi:predicted nuclease with TOPRIM domain